MELLAVEVESTARFLNNISEESFSQKTRKVAFQTARRGQLGASGKNAG
jgi:hypothetical protein